MSSELVGILERALGSRSRTAVEAGRRAAVNVMLHPTGPATTEVLLIQRTSRPDDPWSGQISFPGGRVDPSDATPLAAAIREAREEVGIDLERAGRLLGRSDDMRAMARGRPVDLVITPHVFVLPEVPPLTLQQEEVAGVLWAPLEEMASGRLDSVYVHQRPGHDEAIKLPCYTVDGKVIWGLTYMMLLNLFRIVERAGSDGSPGH